MTPPDEDGGTLVDVDAAEPLPWVPGGGQTEIRERVRRERDQ